MTTASPRIKCDKRLKTELRRRTVIHDGTDEQLAEKAAYFILMMPETVPWYAGVVYDGHSLSRKEDGWLLVVRASTGGLPKVSFTGGATPFEAVRNFAWQLVNARIDWKPDKFKVK